jgi:hypothetical protein
MDEPEEAMSNSEAWYAATKKPMHFFMNEASAACLE